MTHGNHDKDRNAVSFREFQLRLPASPGSSASSRALLIRASRQLYIPKELERDGLAGYEPETLACLLTVLGLLPSGLFLDIGANVGVYALVAAALSDWQVVAFEPTPDIAEAAERIRDDNALCHKIEELALGPNKGEATLYISALTDSSNSLLKGFRRSSSSLPIQVDTIDNYCTSNALVPRLVKIDTEATEPDVIRGGLNTIQQHRPWIICEVLKNRTEHELMELMRPLDYHWYQLTGQMPFSARTEIEGCPKYRFNNWLFSPLQLGKTFSSMYQDWLLEVAKCSPGSKTTPHKMDVKPIRAPREHIQTEYAENTSYVQFT